MGEAVAQVNSVKGALALISFASLDDSIERYAHLAALATTTLERVEAILEQLRRRTYPAFSPGAKGILRIVKWPNDEGGVEFAIGIQHPGETSGRCFAFAETMQVALDICRQWHGYEVRDLTTANGDDHGEGRN